MTAHDVIIVGGGVIGCAVAFNLVKHGRKVLVIEKTEIAAGGSSRNVGGVRQSARDPRELPIAMDAVRRLWPILSVELEVDVEYNRAGNLRLGKTVSHMASLRTMVDVAKSQGLEVEMLSSERVRDICPFASDEIMGASYCATDGHANPMKTTLAYYRKSLAMGAEFQTGGAAQSLRMRKGKVVGVEVNGEAYSADRVLLATGLNARALAATVGIDLPMRKVTAEALVTEAQPPLFPQMFGTAAADFYGHQTNHGSFVFGGTTGLEPFARDELLASTRHNTAPSLCRAILGYFPSLKGVNVVRTWAGFIDDTPDHVPILGAVDEVAGLYVACGFSGHGFGIAPTVGEIMADVITDKQPRLELDAFRYDRFLPKC
jgi:sarcosine oxidase subunit beta